MKTCYIPLVGSESFSISFNENLKSPDRVRGSYPVSTNTTVDKVHYARARRKHINYSGSDLRVLVNELRGRARLRLGYYPVVKEDERDLVSDNLGISTDGRLEICNCSIQKAEKGFVVLPNLYTFISYDARGKSKELVGVPKIKTTGEGDLQPELLRLLWNNVVTYPEDYSDGILPPLDGFSILGKQGKWERTGDMPSEDSVRIILRNNMFCIPLERIANLNGRIYVQVRKTSDGYVDFSRLGSFLGLRDNGLRPVEFTSLKKAGILDRKKRKAEELRLARNLFKDISKSGRTSGIKRVRIEEKDDPDGVIEFEYVDGSPSYKSGTGSYIRAKYRDSIGRTNERRVRRVIKALWRDRRGAILSKYPEKVRKLRRQGHEVEDNHIKNPEGISYRILNRDQLAPLLKIALRRGELRVEDFFEDGDEEPSEEKKIRTRTVSDSGLTVAGIVDNGMSYDGGEVKVIDDPYSLRFVERYRPSIRHAMGKEDISPSEVSAQIKVDLSRVLLSIENPLIHGFASPGLVDSKTRYMRRILRMAEDDLRRKKLERAYKEYSLSMTDAASFLPALKLLALDFMRERFRPSAKTCSFESSSEFGWMNSLMTDVLGDNYLGAIAYGSYPRFLRGEATDFNDRDFFVMVHDYVEAIRSLVNSGLRHRDGKLVNLVLIPAQDFNTFMSIKPDSVVQMCEGFSINGRTDCPIPSNKSITKLSLYHLALRHNILRNMCATFSSSSDLLLRNRGLLNGLVKSPVFNLEGVLNIAAGWGVSREETERAYLQLLKRYNLKDSRGVEANSREEASLLLANATFVDSMILSYFQRQFERIVSIKTSGMSEDAVKNNIRAIESKARQTAAKTFAASLE